MSLPPVRPLADLPDSLLADLRERCAAAGYDEDVLAEAEGIAPGLFSREVRPIIHHVLARRGSPAGALARLFAYGDVLERSAAIGLLGERLVDALLGCGVLVRDETAGGALRAGFQVRPFEGLVLFADDPTSGRDAVMPPAGTTRQMTQVVAPSVSGSVIDVGCGPGSLGLVAAQRGASRVLGTDVNPRAVELARLNARMNGVTAAEFTAGDLVEPARDERFDLALAQPPYVIQPPESAAVTFLHGGPTGEELALRLVAALPGVLAPGGRALVLMEAVARPDEPLHARLRPLIGEAPVDLLVLSAAGPPPTLQVVAYASLEVPEGGAAYAAAARRYLEHLETLNAAEFHHALVVLERRPAGDAGQRRLAATVPVSNIGRGDAAALERLLASVRLAGLGDASLLERTVRSVARARWVEERPGPDPEAEPTRSVRFVGSSFGSEFEIPEERYWMATILERSETVGAAVEGFASAAERSPEDVRREVLAFVREGLMRGLFEPAASDRD